MVNVPLYETASDGAKSKVKLAVKWMAPEAFVREAYTTQSDVLALYTPNVYEMGGGEIFFHKFT